MGLRYRTPISSLREQRRKAEELSTPQTSVSKAQPRTRSHADGAQISIENDIKREQLLHRLRQAVTNDTAPKDQTPHASAYESIQDELARIGQMHQNRRQGEPIAEFELKHELQPSPIEVRTTKIAVVRDAGPAPGSIQKLEAPLSNLDCYVKKLRSRDEPRPLALVPTEAPQQAVIENKEPSSIAASLTQASMNHQEKRAATNQTVLPRSLVLSLLSDS